jgi:hypothetical protein
MEEGCVTFHFVIQHQVSGGRLAVVEAFVLEMNAAKRAHELLDDRIARKIAGAAESMPASKFIGYVWSLLNDQRVYRVPFEEATRIEWRIVDVKDFWQS